MALVSAMIPVYNGEQYIAEAIESILAQDYEPVELIVVDDGSTDDTARIVKAFGNKLRYAYQTNQKIGAARNHCLRLAKGTYLAFLDADDLWLSDKISKQVAAFDTDPTIDIVIGHVQPFISPELTRDQIPIKSIPTDPLPGHHATTALMKRDCFERVGIFSEAKPSSAFVDWTLRARNLGLREFLLPDVVSKRRFHQSNHSYNDAQKRHDYFQIVRESIRRKRLQNQDSS